MAFVQGTIDYSGVSCPAGTEIVYSLDGGTTWQTTPPTYAEIDAANDEVCISCRCLDDPTVIGVASCTTITPVDPSTCCTAQSPTGAPVVVDSNCNG